jgi:uncharacterized protein YgiM (DUF1202 family)
VIIVNRKRFTTVLIAAMMVSVMALGIVGCKKAKATETTLESTEQTTTTTTTIPTTTLTEYSGPMPNDEPISWTETALETPATYYVQVSKGEFLNVRKGPNTTYEKVGTLTRGQTVVVVAKASGGWYKTEDGFYVSETYLTGTMPN